MHSRWSFKTSFLRFFVQRLHQHHFNDISDFSLLGSIMLLVLQSLEASPSQILETVKKSRSFHFAFARPYNTESKLQLCVNMQQVFILRYAFRIRSIPTKNLIFNADAGHKL